MFNITNPVFHTCIEASRSRIESTEIEQREYEDEGMYCGVELVLGR